MKQIVKIIITAAVFSLSANQAVAHEHSSGHADTAPKSAASVGDLSLQTETIVEGLYVLMGKRAIGNVLVSIGKDGTFLVDDQFEKSAPEILRSVEALGGSSPRFIINSHYHHDHAGGNEPFGEAGAIIAAHDNARKLLAQGTEIKMLNLVVPPAPKAALPVITFAKEIKLHLNGNQVHLSHMPGAHTESDIAIHLVESNVIHVGDVWNYTGNYPFIDASYGGSLAGMIAGQQAIAEMADDKTVIVPGHGPLANKAELVAYTNILSEIFQLLTEHAKQGHTLEEVIAAKPVSKVKEFTTGIINQSMWLSVVYPKIKESLQGG